MCHMLAVAPPMSLTTPVQPGTFFRDSISRSTDASLRETTSRPWCSVMQQKLQPAAQPRMMVTLEADLLPRRDLRLAVHGVRQAREGQLVLLVDQFRRGRRRGWVDVHQVAPVLLQKNARVVGVVLEVVEPRKLGVDFLVSGDLFVRGQPDFLAVARAGPVPPALLDIVAEAHPRAAHVGDAPDVPARAEPRGRF